MKKFISAISSLVIAATAMGGALAVSTDAATNGDVASTIIEFRSNGKNTVTGEKGKTVPVSMYIPQSSGFYSLSLKMSINGKETLGKGTVTDLKGGEHKDYKYAFGNYGIKIKNVVWPGDEAEDADNDFYCCIDSGAVHEDGKGNSMFAGFANADSMTFFTADAYNIQYQSPSAIKIEKNIDALAPWVAAGKPDDYSNYNPVYTWTKDEDWAYKYAFVTFDLELPSDLADGTYSLDLYYDEYYNTNPSALFDEKTNEELPDSEKTVGQTGAAGVKGAQKLESVPLKITVGDAPVETTKAPDETTKAPETTTTAKPAETTKAPETTTGAPVSADAIIYDLVPNGKDFTAAPAASAGQNVYTATPGEELTIDWTVKNDGGTAGLQMYFDFSEVEYVSAKSGSAYRVSPQFNDAKANVSKSEDADEGGLVCYTFGGEKELKAKDGAVIYSFNVKVPTEPGTYSIKQDTRSNNPTKVVPKDQDHPYETLVHGLDIVVPGGTTKAPEETTKPQETTKPEETTKPQETTKPEETTTTTTAKPDETTAPVQTTTPDGVLFGDVNCDGSVKINDVVLLNRYLNKTATLTDQGAKNADCVNDGELKENDSEAIKDFLARILKALPKK